jgi:hypothetical protein
MARLHMQLFGEVRAGVLGVLDACLRVVHGVSVEDAHCQCIPSEFHPKPVLILALLGQRLPRKFAQEDLSVRLDLATTLVRATHHELVVPRASATHSCSAGRTLQILLLHP